MKQGTQVLIGNTGDLLDLVNHNTGVTMNFIKKQVKRNKRSKLVTVAMVVAIADLYLTTRENRAEIDALKLEIASLKTPCHGDNVNTEGE